MPLRVCLGCSCRYAVGPRACPQCGTRTRNAIYDWEDDVAKANPDSGATFYLPEGCPVPDDLPDGVRPVGPGAPAEAAALPPVSAPKAEWVEHAEATGVLLRGEAEAMTKADLVETVRQAGPELRAPLAPLSAGGGKP